MTTVGQTPASDPSQKKLKPKKQNKAALDAEAKANSNRNPDNDAANQAVLDTLLPLVSAKIDGSGGVMRISDLGQLPEIQDQLKMIPLGYPKSLTKILKTFSDFFVIMSDGLVGTAMGYDTGMIQENGILNPACAQNLKGVKSHDTGGKKKLATGMASNKKGMDLTEAADDLWNACIDLSLDNEAGLFAAFSRVQGCRQEARQNPIAQDHIAKIKATQLKGSKKTEGLIHLNNEEREERRQKTLEKVIELLQQAEGKQMALNLLVGNPLIRDMKKGAISKFMSWLNTFPALFDVTPIDNSPQFRVTYIGAPNAATKA